MFLVGHGCGKDPVPLHSLVVQSLSGRRERPAPIGTVLIVRPLLNVAAGFELAQGPAGGTAIDAQGAVPVAIALTLWFWPQRPRTDTGPFRVRRS